MHYLAFLNKLSFDNLIVVKWMKLIINLKEYFGIPDLLNSSWFCVSWLEFVA